MPKRAFVVFSSTSLDEDTLFFRRSSIETEPKKYLSAFLPGGEQIIEDGGEGDHMSAKDILRQILPDQLGNEVAGVIMDFIENPSVHIGIIIEGETTW